jgi:hypothetical protein
MDALLEYTSAGHLPHTLSQQAAKPIKPLVINSNLIVGLHYRLIGPFFD